MITKIIIQRFKSIESATLELGKFNIFIGTNASGKSNLFDALRVLQGIGNGFTIDEIFNGKAKTATNLSWEGIRGGSSGVVFSPFSSSTKSKTFSIEVWATADNTQYHYFIEIHPEKAFVVEEKLSVNEREVFYSKERVTERAVDHRVAYPPPSKGNHIVNKFMKNLPCIHQLIENTDEGFTLDKITEIRKFIRIISDVQKIDLVPGLLRDYSKQQYAERIGERGEDFASVVNRIYSDDKKRKAFVSWLGKLTPSDVDDITIFDGAVGEKMFGVIEKGKRIPAPRLSDGTLRFSALTATLFQESMPKILLLEEVDNGIHPTRLRLLVELFVSRTEKIDTQVIITTHSPILLSWLQETLYRFTFHCSRKENGASVIQPIILIPHFNEIIKKQPLSGLFAEGWLENAL